MAFEPGHKDRFPAGNKKGRGRPPKPQELQQLQALNHFEVADRISSIMRMTPETFKAFAENPNNTMLDIAVLRLMKMIVEKGDYQCLEFFFNRTVGKVKDSVELDVTVAQREKAHADLVDEIPREKLIELVRLKTGNADE